MYGKDYVLSAPILLVSPLGVEMVLRLEICAWWMFKWLRRAISELPVPAPLPHVLCKKRLLSGRTCSFSLTVFIFFHVVHFFFALSC